MLPIVIPYQTSKDELRYMLRSVQAFYGTPEIFIIGDQTKFKVHHLPFKQDPIQCRNKNVMQKLLLASEVLKTDFIRWSDDIFALAPIISIPYYAEGTMMEASLKCGFMKAKFRLCVNNTMKKVGPTAPFFDIHTPCPFHHESFREFCAVSSWDGYYTNILRSYYYNWLKATPTPFIDLKMTKERTASETNELCKERLYVSVGDDALKGGLRSWLNQMFPEPSIWE
jgi:hypothetical protein